MRTISLDFDGVIHSYTSPWTNARTIPDQPVDGAIAFLRALVESKEWDVCIFSTRNEDADGVLAMRQWLHMHTTLENPAPDDKQEWISKIRFPTEKPKAFVGLDDRVITFEGTFPSLEALAKFKPWNRR